MVMRRDAERVQVPFMGNDQSEFQLTQFLRHVIGINGDGAGKVNKTPSPIPIIQFYLNPFSPKYFNFLQRILTARRTKFLHQTQYFIIVSFHDDFTFSKFSREDRLGTSGRGSHVGTLTLQAHLFKIQFSFKSQIFIHIHSLSFKFISLHFTSSDFIS